MTTWCAPGHKDRMRTQASDSETSRFFLAQTFLEPRWHLPPPTPLGPPSRRDPRGLALFSALDLSTSVPSSWLTGFLHSLECWGLVPAVLGHGGGVAQSPL